MKISKKIVIVSILCVSVLIILISTSSSWLSSSKLTKSHIDELIRAKGAENLSWEDFEKYPHIDVGSGNYVYQYDIVGGSHLYLSGTSLSAPPMYIYIIDTKGNREDILKR